MDSEEYILWVFVPDPMTLENVLDLRKFAKENAYLEWLELRDKIFRPRCVDTLKAFGEMK